jgi:MFS family permease
MRFWSKWGLCILLFLATTLNYLDRQVLSVLAPTVQAEIHFGNEKLGWLFSVFYITYAVGQMAIGTVLDRTSLRIFYASRSSPGLGIGRCGAGNRFVSLLVLRGLLGVMEAPNWPSALRILSRALPPKERTLGNGIFTSGTSVGALIAPALSLGIAGCSVAMGIHRAGRPRPAVVRGLDGFTRSATLKPAWTTRPIRRRTKTEHVAPAGLWAAAASPLLVRLAHHDHHQPVSLLHHQLAADVFARCAG